MTVTDGREPLGNRKSAIPAAPAVTTTRRPLLMPILPLWQSSWIYHGYAPVRRYRARCERRRTARHRKRHRRVPGCRALVPRQAVRDQLGSARRQMSTELTVFPLDRIGCGAQVQSAVLEFHPSRLRLTGPVREQGHEHRVSQGLLFLVDVERSRVGEVGGRFRGVIVGRPGEPVPGAEVGTVRLGELGRHVAGLRICARIAEAPALRDVIVKIARPQRASGGGRGRCRVTAPLVRSTTSICAAGWVTVAKAGRV